MFRTQHGLGHLQFRFKQVCNTKTSSSSEVKLPFFKGNNLFLLKYLGILLVVCTAVCVWLWQGMYHRFSPLSCSSATIRLSIAQLQLLGDYEPSSSCLNSEADLAKGAIVTAEGEREEPALLPVSFYHVCMPRNPWLQQHYCCLGISRFDSNIAQFGLALPGVTLSDLESHSRKQSTR